MRPTVRSRRLGRRLRNYREELGLSGAALASRIGLGQPHLSKMENGRATISAEQLALIVRELGIPAAIVSDLEQLRSRAERPGWWQDYGDILAEPVQCLIELEAEASWIRTYDGSVVPGLLQTREYAERIITAAAPHLRIGDIDRYLELRMTRQKRLAGGMRLTAVVSEAAIRQQIGGPGVLADQLRHVRAATLERDVTFQVVPFTADAHAALTETFVIIQWPQESDPEAVYVDGETSWTVHENRGAIRQYLHAFASVQTQALSPRDTLDLITDVIKELS